MRKTALIKLNTNKLFFKLKINILEIIFVILFIIGLFVGCYLVKNYEAIRSASEDYFKTFLSSRNSVGFFGITLKSILDSLPIFLFVFLSGTSLIGVVLIPLLVFLKGSLIGIYTGFIYSNYLLKGIAFNALFFIPVNIILIFALIVCSKISFSYSAILLKISMPKSYSVNLSNNFQSYYKRFSLTALLLIFSAIIDALMSSSFLGLFNF